MRNQNQVLTSRNAELETQNARLLERLRQSGGQRRVPADPEPSFALTGRVTAGSRGPQRCD